MKLMWSERFKECLKDKLEMVNEKVKKRLIIKNGAFWKVSKKATMTWRLREDYREKRELITAKNYKNKKTTNGGNLIFICLNCRKNG